MKEQEGVMEIIYRSHITGVTPFNSNLKINSNK